MAGSVVMAMYVGEFIILEDGVICPGLRIARRFIAADHLTRFYEAVKLVSEH